MAVPYRFRQSCEVVEYSYHYMRDDGSLIARVCKNTGHEGETGGSLTHMHLPRSEGEDRVLRASEYDFDDAVEFLRAIGEATRSH